MPDIFVLIESNSTGTGRVFTRTLRDLGIEPVVLAKDPARYPYLATDRVAVRVVDTCSLEAMNRALNEWTLDHCIRGIYSSSEYFIQAAALLASLHGLSGADPEAVAVCRDKYRTRRALRTAQLPVPKFYFFRSVEDIDTALREIQLPVVVKPSHGTGSVGVRLCTNRQVAVQHAARILSQRVNERGLPVPPEGLVEEFIEGPEYSVETFGRTVVGITQKHVCEPPSFVEVGHDFPARLSPSQQAGVHETVLSALQALNLLWGPAHTEVKLSPQGLYIIEVNPRLAGGHIPTLVKQATGADLIRSTLELAAGKAATVTSRTAGFASIRFMLTPGTGTLVETRGVDIARMTPGVIDVQLYCESAQQVTVHGDFRDRLGHVIAVGSDPTYAAESADRALRAISLQLAQQSPQLPCTGSCIPRNTAAAVCAISN